MAAIQTHSLQPVPAKSLCSSVENGAAEARPHLTYDVREDGN
jgi:hypothetical protein